MATRKRLLRVERLIRLWIAASRGRKQSFETCLVLAQARTGSTLLLSYLNSLPQVDLAGEVLNPKVPSGLGDAAVSRKRALRHIRESVRARSGPVRGTKLLLHQLRNVGISLDDLAELFPEGKLIVLYRRSLARQFTSHKIAEATGRWTSRSGRPDPGPIQIDVDPEEFNRFCRQQRTDYTALMAHPWVQARTLLVAYEETTADPQRLFDEKVCPFLGVDRGEVATDLSKQNTRAIGDVVRNYDEVRTLLNDDLAHLELQPS